MVQCARAGGQGGNCTGMVECARQVAKARDPEHRDTKLRVGADTVSSTVLEEMGEVEEQMWVRVGGMHTGCAALRQGRPGGGKVYAVCDPLTLQELSEAIQISRRRSEISCCRRGG